MKSKKIYLRLKNFLEKLPNELDLLKTTVAENMAILRKRPIYEKIKWSSEQQKYFDDFWVNSYGRKISNKWHRLYEASSGSFSVDYIPEKLYTTKREPAFNDALYAKALEDKSMVELLSYGCGCVVPRTFIICSNGQFYDGNRKPITKEQAI